MTCIECQNFDMQAAAGYAKLGMGKCRAKSLGPGTFVTAAYARECDEFNQAAPGVAEKRAAFLDNSSGRRLQSQKTV